MDKLKKELETTYKTKERLERKIKSLKRSADEAFQTQMELEDQKSRHRQAALNGEHGVSFTRDDLFSIDQKIEKARQECEQFSNELKETKTKLEVAIKQYETAKADFKKAYAKWAVSQWKSLVKIVQDADVVSDEMSELAEFAWTYGKIPTLAPSGKASKILQGKSGVDRKFSPENRLRELQKIA